MRARVLLGWAMRRANGGSLLVGMTTIAAAPVPVQWRDVSEKQVEVVSRWGRKEPSVHMAYMS